MGAGDSKGLNKVASPDITKKFLLCYGISYTVFNWSVGLS